MLLTRFDENIVTAEHQPAGLPATLALAPNLAGVLLTVQYNGLDQVKIFTAAGQLLSTLAVESPDIPLQINIGDLKSGFYAIAGYSGQRAVARGKFIKI